MPKATPAIRQSNAAAKALATVAKLHSEENHGPRLSVVAPSGNSSQESEESSAEIETGEDLGDLPRSESDEVDEENIVPASAAKKAVNRMKWDKASGEDFFDYLNSIPQEERTQGRLRFFATNHDGSIGGMVHQIVGGWVDVDESWMRQQTEIGIGKFKVELRNPGRSGRANDWTIVQIGSDDEINKQRRNKEGRNKEAGSEDDNKAVDVVASAAEKGMGFLGKSYEKALEVRQANSDPMALAKALSEMKGSQPDMGTLLTGMAAIITASAPKPIEEKEDKTSGIMMKMLENQAAEAVRRADAAEKRAEEQAAAQERRFEEMRRRDKEESDRREKAAIDAATASAARDQKFFEIMLKDKEKKSDEFGIMDMIKGVVVPLVKDRLESGAGVEGWSGVVGQLIDRAPDAIAGVSAMMAARNGATPAQVQALQHQNPQAAQQPIENEFQEMIHRLGKYMSRDTGLWLTEAGIAYIAGDPGDEDSDPIAGMIQVEYPAIFEGLFVGQPKDAIIASINGTQIGAAIMANPQGSEFMNKVIDSIKLQMVPGADKPEEVPAEPVRKNGKAKAHA